MSVPAGQLVPTGSSGPCDSPCTWPPWDSGVTSGKAALFGRGRLGGTPPAVGENECLRVRGVGETSGRRVMNLRPGNPCRTSYSESEHKASSTAATAEAQGTGHGGHRLCSVAVNLVG